MSNGRMDVDPKMQREFIEILNRQIYDIGRMTELLESRLTLLGHKWTDREYEVFRGKIAGLKVVLAKFVEEGRQLSAKLADSATLAENYQKIRD
ncbi:hypothetical protein HUU62_04815 [Rhodoferax sp. 4810]|nr:hypothetical protein [Rhodoferax jenense]